METINISSSKKRLDYIDSARGIGIVLVVFGHLLNQNSDLYSIIYSFHVPFFFLLSGMFLNPTLKFVSYLLKYIKRLLFPYVVVFLIGVLFTSLYSGFNSLKPDELFSQFIYANPIKIHVGPIWFFACFFDSVILFYFFYKTILSKVNYLFSCISIGVLCIVAFYIPQIETKTGIYLPFKLDVSFMALVFLSIGYIFKKQIMKQESLSSIKKIITLLILVFLVVTISHFLIGQTYLSGGLYGHDIFLYIFTALCGSLLIIILGMIFERIRILCLIGKESLLIFSLHSLLITLFNQILSCLGLETSFIFSIIGVCLVVPIMLVFAIAINAIKKKIFKVFVN